MGKSKYQKNVNSRINEKELGRPVYYDEKIKHIKEPVTVSRGLYVMIIAGIVIAAGLIAGFTFFGNDVNTYGTNGGDTDGGTDDGTGGDDPIDPGTTTKVIEAGDDFTAYYTLWVANVPGETGVVDSNSEPYQTSSSPVEFNTEGVIPGFKANVLGMEEGEDKYFELASGEGYISGDLAYYKLAFHVRVVTISK